MRRIYNFKIKKESFEDMNKAGRWNPSLEITFTDRTGEHTHKIGAGHSDVIDVYRFGSETYLLSHHTGFGYYGLEVFNGADKIGELFLESHQVKETIGREDLAPFNTIKRMLEYIQ